MTVSCNMTSKNAIEVWSDLINKNTHPPPCTCPACLYILQKENKIKGMRKPFGIMTFFLNWLIHSVKIEYLLDKEISEKKGKVSKQWDNVIPIPLNQENKDNFIIKLAKEMYMILATISEKGKEKKEIKLYNMKPYLYNPNAYEKAPYLKRTNEIIEKLYTNPKFEDFAPDFEKLTHNYLSIRRHKIEHSNFPKLLDKLSNIRLDEWIKTQPYLKKEWRKNWDNFQIAQKVANYIHKQPTRRVTSRDLQRYLNVKKSDIERVHDLLESNFNIMCPGKGIRNRRTFYYAGY